MKRSLKISTAVLAAILLSGTVPAVAQQGSTAYNFLELTSSARAMALGGTNITVIDDDVALADQNPALIGPEIDKQIAVNYMYYLNSGNFAGVRYGMAAGERGAWSAAIQYLGYGAIDRYDANGTATGSFSPQDVVFGATYAHDFTDNLRGGINLKGVYSNYDEFNAFALAVDLGINYYNPDKDLSLSAVIKNLGGQVKRFDKAYDRLPWDIQLGYMQAVGSSPFSVSITAYHLTKWKLPYYEHKEDGENVSETKNGFLPNFFRHLIFGVQYSPSEKFYIDLAYNYKVHSDMSAYQRSLLSGFSVGLGLKVKSFAFGVAYAQPHKSGNSIMLNISTNLQELFHR